MRGILLLIITIPLSLVAAFDGRIGLLAYISFSLLRPDYMAFAAGRFNYSLMIALGLLVGSIRYLTDVLFLGPRTFFFWCLLLLQVPLYLSAIFAVYPAYATNSYMQFLRMSVIMLLIPGLVSNLEQFKRLFLVTAISLGIHGFWYGFTGTLSGGARIHVGIGGFMSDNNSFAIGLAMILPFLWYAPALFEKKWMRMGLFAMFGFTLMAIVLTFSRGGALAAGTSVLMLAWRSRRRFLVMALVVLSLLPVGYLVSQEYFARIGSIQNYEEDSSSMARLVHMRLSIDIWRDRPLLGVGFGDNNYLLILENYLNDETASGGNVIVHNSFLWMLVHCGIFAFVIFTVAVFGAAFSAWRSARRMRKLIPSLAFYPEALLVSLCTYIVASMFHPRATFDFIYMLIMYVGTWRLIEKGLIQELAQQQAAAADYPRPAFQPSL